MNPGNKVFLGGTCAQSSWREELIPLLKMDYFNPLVEEWTPEVQAREELEKESFCNIHFYLIMKDLVGVYSIAEIIDSVHQKDKKTILQVQPDGFENHLLKSLEAVVELVNRRGGYAFIDQNIHTAAQYLNNNYSNL